MASRVIDARPMPPKPEKRIKKARKPLRKVSIGKRAVHATYRLLKMAWRRKHKTCEFVWCGIPCGCPAMMSPHHRKGRGSYLLDTSTWIATCFRHHRYIHDNPAYSYKYGYLLRRWK